MKTIVNGGVKARLTLSAHEAQVFAHSLYHVLKRKESPTCSFKYKNDVVAVYPDSGSVSDLGFDHLCGPRGSRGNVWTAWSCVGAAEVSMWEQLCRAKKTNLENLYRDLQCRQPRPGANV